MIGTRSAQGVPPWSMAVAAMLAVQLSNALSVPVIEQVVAGGAAQRGGARMADPITTTDLSASAAKETP